MKLTITIKCDNAAFDPTPDAEVIRILRRVCDRVSEYGVRMSGGRLLDVNGNTVGDIVLDFS